MSEEHAPYSVQREDCLFCSVLCEHYFYYNPSVNFNLHRREELDKKGFY